MFVSDFGVLGGGWVGVAAVCLGVMRWQAAGWVALGVVNVRIGQCCSQRSPCTIRPALA